MEWPQVEYYATMNKLSKTTCNNVDKSHKCDIGMEISLEK